MADYDVILLGAGGAGSEIAHYANGKGLKVAMVERDKLGGQCLNYGCDPTKSLLETARLYHLARESRRFGARLQADPPDMAAIMESKDTVLERMSGGGDIVARLRATGIDYYEGHGRFLDPTTIEVDGRRLTARDVVITTGTRPSVPDVPGLADVGYITNIEAVSLDRLPRRLAIIGAGPIGLEFAQLFSRLGVRVTLLEAADQIAMTEEPELREMLKEVLLAEGIDVVEDAEIRSVTRTGDGIRIVMRATGVHPRDMADVPLFDRERMFIAEGIAAGAERAVVVDQVLAAAGRTPNIDDIGLERIGAERTAKGVVVDDRLRTTVPHVWACGDVTGMYPFTHMADYQAQVLRANLVDGRDVRANYDVVPWCIFTDPEVGHVGRLAQAARSEGLSVFQTVFDLDELPRLLTLRQPYGRIKLVVEGTGRFLGVHILAPEAGSTLAAAALAMKHRLTVHQVADTVLPYPTMAEGFRWACKQASEELLRM